MLIVGRCKSAAATQFGYAKDVLKFELGQLPWLSLWMLSGSADGVLFLGHHVSGLAAMTARDGNGGMPSFDNSVFLGCDDRDFPALLNKVPQNLLRGGGFLFSFVER